MVRMRFAESTWHMIDFEGSLNGGVAEYAVVSVERGRITAMRTRLCRPHGRIRREETAVHGLDAAMLAGFAPMDADWELFRDLRASGPFAAHHASTENAFLKRLWPHPPYSPNAAGGPAVASWGPWMDSHAIYKRLYPQLPSHALMALVDVFGMGGRLQAEARTHCPAGRDRPHRAPYDALASALLLLRLAELPGFEAATLPWLLDMTGGGEPSLFNET